MAISAIGKSAGKIVNNIGEQALRPNIYRKPTPAKKAKIVIDPANVAEANRLSKFVKKIIIKTEEAKKGQVTSTVKNDEKIQNLVDTF